MSNVTFRQVRHKLRGMVGGPRGLRMSEALARAEANLESTAAQCLDELDAGLAELTLLVGHARAERPDDATLLHIRRVAGAMMAYCLHKPLPAMAKVLAKLCYMADTLAATQYWISGALDPAVELAVLCRRGGIPDSHVALLLEGLDACIEQYRSHEPATA